MTHDQEKKTSARLLSIQHTERNYYQDAGQVLSPLVLMNLHDRFSKDSDILLQSRCSSPPPSHLAVLSGACVDEFDYFAPKTVH